MTSKYKVSLVMQNAWDTTQLTMPLALGYLKAYALADDEIARHFDISIANYPRRTSVSRMALDLLESPPDILAFSVLGWNYQSFGRLTESFAQLRTPGQRWCIFGGVHVSHQGERVFRAWPSVDIVVNGEGELTFRELLRAFLHGRRTQELTDVAGITFRREDGVLHTTPDRPRLKELDQIPSPFLTGAIPMRDGQGRFLYDVALMETNRGCPYKCAFCYWGGAIGQKISRFSIERVRQELEFFSELGIENVALCDANFGMLPEDLAFVEHMIALRARTSYPRSFVTSWAKNKSRIFYEIVARLKETGFHCDFTLSLQTLSEDALVEMRRENMKVNAFDDLCQWLRQQKMSAHVELIWGLPGETLESFIEGYDRIAKWHPRIATYPLCILPNTAYSDDRDKYQMLTVRDSATDFEFVLSHKTLSLKDNRRMHRFLFWARLSAEYQLFRHIWCPLRLFAGLRQSEVVTRLGDWAAQGESPVLVGLRSYLDNVVENFDITLVSAAAAYAHQHGDELGLLLEEWWMGWIERDVPVELRHFLRDVFRYDWATRPRADGAAARAGMPIVHLEGEGFYGPETHSFGYEVVALLERLRNDESVQVLPREWTVTLYFRRGFDAVVDSHEFVPRFVGLTRETIEEEADRRRRGLLASTVQPHVVGLPQDRSLWPIQLRKEG